MCQIMLKISETFHIEVQIENRKKQNELTAETEIGILSENNN